MENLNLEERDKTYLPFLNISALIAAALSGIRRIAMDTPSLSGTHDFSQYMPIPDQKNQDTPLTERPYTSRKETVNYTSRRKTKPRTGSRTRK